MTDIKRFKPTQQFQQSQKKNYQKAWGVIGYICDSMERDRFEPPKDSEIRFGSLSFSSRRM